MKNKNFDSILNKIYYDLNSPVAYSSKNNVFAAAKKIDKSINRSDVDTWFKKQLAPTLHKPVRYRFPRNKTIVMSIGEQYQADLCDMAKFSAQNDNMKFLLTCIDCFSKFAWAIPIKNKTSHEIVRVLKIIFAKQVCKRLQTDKGREFLNSNVRALLKENGVELWISENEDVKASIVERFNRTLKTRMWKYFTAHNDTRRYIDILPQLVNGYNNTIHSSIKMKPSKVEKKDEMNIRKRLYSKHLPSKRYKYKLNTPVRISKARRTFKKGYMKNWTEEIFNIHSREGKNRPLYEIKDFNGQPIKGKFYEEELQEVDNPTEFRIESILKKKRKGKQTLYLVKWSGYDSSFNSWVNEKDLKNVSENSST